jgi:hypothetical protein
MKKMFNRYLIKVQILLLVYFVSACNDPEPIIRDDRDATIDLVTKVYKTRGDYFTYVNTWGKENAPTTLSLENPNIVEVIGNDTVYKGRHRLIDDYVMAVAVNLGDYFTDIPINEIVAYNAARGHGSYYPLESIFSRVIDKYPFVEFYSDENHLFFARDSIRIEQLNEIIRKGELEQYLTRLK